MPFNPDPSDNTLPDAGPRNYRVMPTVTILISVAVATGVIMIVDHWDAVNNAFAIGNGLVKQGVHDIFASLRLILHQAYRWIFKTCG